MIQKTDRDTITDLKTHENCELQIRDPFKDGNLSLWCLDHEMFIYTWRKK